MIPLAAPEFANTIAGALAPAISLLAVAVATLAVRKIDRHRGEVRERVEEAKEETVAQVTETVDRTKDAIRGDLKNGLNVRLGHIERMVESVDAAQQEIRRRLDQLEHHPPSHLG